MYCEEAALFSVFVHTRHSSPDAVTIAGSGSECSTVYPFTDIFKKHPGILRLQDKGPEYWIDIASLDDKLVWVIKAHRFEMCGTEIYVL